MRALSEADPYLPAYARDVQLRRPDWLEIRAAAQRAMALERPFRGQQLDAICERFGVCRRSLYRYVQGDIVLLHLGGWAAGYLLIEGRSPVRVTQWAPSTWS